MKSTSIVASARRTLRDDFATVSAYSDDDFVDYINRAVKLVVNADSSASVTTGQIPLVAGSVQHLPVNGARLLKLLHNDLDKSNTYRIGARTYAGKCAVKEMPLSTLQAQAPDWASADESSVAIFCAFNDDDPTSFIIYPANDGTGILVGSYSFVPADITEIADSPTGTIAVPERFYNIILNTVMALCLLRDTESANAQARSKEFMAAASAELGVKLTADVSDTPDSTVKE